MYRPTSSLNGYAFVFMFVLLIVLVFQRGLW